MSNPKETKVLYMSFDRFLLAVESRDLSQADKSVFFPKAEWWVAELLFQSLNNWGLNFLQNECSQYSQIYLSPEKTEKNVYLSILQILNDKIDQNMNFAKLTSAKWYKCKFYHSKVKVL